MPAMLMAHETDPRENLLRELGNIDDIEIFNNQVLCAVYIRPEKTKSGLFLTDQSREEDKSQGKVGLVVKKGPTAFDHTFREKFSDVEVEVGDWVFFRASDGWPTTVNTKLCRILDDVNVRGRIQHPDMVW